MKARHGNVQCNLQHMQAIIRPTQHQPCLFDTAQFDHRRISSTGLIIPGTQVFQYSQSLQSNDTPTSFYAGTPVSPNYTGINPLWVGQTSDVCDGGSFLPISSHYRFTITGRRNLDNVYVSFTLFRETKRMDQSLGPGIQSVACLPDSLRYLDNIAGNSKNSLPKDRFKVYWHRTILMNSAPALSASGNTDTQGTTANVKYFNFSIRHRGVRTQNVTYPATPESVPTTTGTPPSIDPILDYGPYGTLNTPFGSQLWLLISSTDANTGATDTQQVAITCSRTVYWRDGIGNYRM